MRGFQRTAQVATNLKDLPQIAAQQQPKTQEEEKQEITVNSSPQVDKGLPPTPLTQENLTKAWKRYFTQPHLSARVNVLQNVPLKTKLPYTIVAQAKSQIALDNLEEERIKLMDFLRENLKNHNIELELTLNPEKKNKTQKAYTPEDKFKALSDKYPILQELKQRLDLDII